MYAEMPSGLSEEGGALRTDVRRFGADVLRPASLQLDLLAPGEMIADGSPLWKVLRTWYEMGSHAAALPAAYGGIDLDPGVDVGRLIGLDRVRHQLAGHGWGEVVRRAPASWTVRSLYNIVLPD